VGSISGIPAGVMENPPEIQYKASDLFVPPLIVLAPKQVIIICVPTKT